MWHCVIWLIGISILVQPAASVCSTEEVMVEAAGCPEMLLPIKLHGIMFKVCQVFRNKTLACCRKAMHKPDCQTSIHKYIQYSPMNIFTTVHNIHYTENASMGTQRVDICLRLPQSQQSILTVWAQKVLMWMVGHPYHIFLMNLWKK
jgi:hypothetical protein